MTCGTLRMATRTPHGDRGARAARADSLFLIVITDFYLAGAIPDRSWSAPPRPHGTLRVSPRAQRGRRGYTYHYIISY